MSSVEDGLNSFSFEINAFNLVRNASNCKMVLGDAKECLMLTEEPDSNKDSEKKIGSKLKAMYDAYVSNNVAGESGKKFW